MWWQFQQEEQLLNGQLTDRVESVLLPTERDHWNKQVWLEKPNLDPSTWTPRNTLQMQGFKPS